MELQIDISEEAGVRYLHFGSSWVQGAMRIARPWSLELEYTREMMLGLLLRDTPNWPPRVLQIGLGAASLTKFLYRHCPETQLKIIELSPNVVPVAYQYFKLPDDPARIDIELGDGADYIDRTEQRYDIIMVDGFDADARAGRLDTAPFYLACRNKLSNDGLMIVNLLSRRRDFRKSIQYIGEAFEGRALAFPSENSGNAVALAAVGEPVIYKLEELKQRAKDLKQQTGLNLAPTLARIERSSYCANGLFIL